MTSLPNGGHHHHDHGEGHEHGDGHHDHGEGHDHGHHGHGHGGEDCDEGGEEVDLSDIIKSLGIKVIFFNPFISLHGY